MAVLAVLAVFGAAREGRAGPPPPRVALPTAGGASRPGMAGAGAASAAPADDPELPRLGALPHGEGMNKAVRFRVWAPHANGAAVQGEFNHWHPEPMERDPKVPGGWVLESRKARPGDAYQYVFNGGIYRRDPQARQVRGHENVSLVTDPWAFRWPATEAAWKTPPASELVAYEMHLGTFAEGLSGNDSAFRKAAKALPYLTGLGVNCIQLMPVNEFPGDRSWGYNPGDVFAIESSYGTPDDFKAFVAACHASGMAVLLDIVHNHWGPGELATWRFDEGDGGDGGGGYFYEDAERAETEWGPRPDFGKAEVRRFILSSVRMFVEEYHIDGFRWDSVFNIRYVPENGATANPDGDALLQEANDWLAKRFPRVLRIAEDHAYDNGGVGFQAQWNSAFQTRISGLLSAPSAQMDIGSFAVALKNLDTGWVQFAECHDSAGDLNNHHRLPRMIDPAKPDSPRAKALSLMGNAIALTVPGIPMFLQGLEMHDTDDFSDQKPIPWGQARGPRRGLVAANAALVKLRRNLDGYTPGLKGDKLSILQADNKGKVIVFARYDSKAGTDAPATVVAMNFSGETRRNYSVRLPGKGVKGNQPVWYCLYNSSQPAYDTDFPAEGPKPVTGWRLPSRHAPLPLDLAPWSTVVLSPMGPRDAPVKLAAAAAEEPPGDWTEDDMLDESLDTFVPPPAVEDYVEELIPPFPYRFLPLP